MKRVIGYFTDSSPLKLILISIVIVVISYFIEKPLPNIFMGLRLIAFILFVYGAIRFLNRK
jgi:uncharacterized membrane protein YiaA